MMGLTATATKATRSTVYCSLGMVAPAVVSGVANTPNIKYVVHANPTSLEESFAPLAEEIRHCRTRMNRVIVYCRTYDSCSMIYLLEVKVEGKDDRAYWFHGPSCLQTGWYVHCMHYTWCKRHHPTILLQARWYIACCRGNCGIRDGVGLSWRPKNLALGTIFGHWTIHAGNRTCWEGWPTFNCSTVCDRLAVSCYRG